MQLQDILYKVSITATVGGTDKDIHAITSDSREAKEGSLFVAIKGLTVDAHDFIPQVIESGATAIICEEIPEGSFDDVAFVKVENSARALGIIASNFYGNPSSKLTLVGVTSRQNYHWCFSGLKQSCGMKQPI